MTAFEIILWALLILAPFYLGRSPRTGSGVHVNDLSRWKQFGGSLERPGPPGPSRKETR